MKVTRAHPFGEGSERLEQALPLPRVFGAPQCLQLRLNAPTASSANDCAWGPAKRQRLGATFGFASPPRAGEGRPTLDGWLVLRDRGLVGEARLRRRGEADDRDGRGDENEWLLHDSPLVAARNLVCDEARLGAG